MYDFSKVLIVDDDAIFGQMIKGWLRGAARAPSPVYFSSGTSFAAEFINNLDDVAVLIIDFDLQEAKSGAEIIRDIRSNWQQGQSIAIIAVSGNEMDQLRGEFRESGADLIFQKDQLECGSFVDFVQAMFHLSADRRIKEVKFQEMSARIYQLEQKISVTSIAIREHLFTEGDPQSASLLRQLERNLRD